MVTNDLPVLILTRPVADARRLETALRKFCPDFRAIRSPLLEIERVGSVLDIEPDTELIFTSVNGVQNAQFSTVPERQIAWCVGERTAQAARDAGFVARSAAGDAGDLIALIRSRIGDAPLLHVRGAHARGQISRVLQDDGSDVREAIVYDQRPKRLSDDAMATLSGAKPVILPVFSPRTAELLLKQGPFQAPLVFVAISDTVAEVLGKGPNQTVHVASEPNLGAMVASICATLGGKRDASSP